LPSGELRCCRASVHGEPLSFGTIADQAAQRPGQRGHVIRWNQEQGQAEKRPPNFSTLYMLANTAPLVEHMFKNADTNGEIDRLVRDSS
jgi:hypothetical protein